MRKLLFGLALIPIIAVLIWFMNFNPEKQQASLDFVTMPDGFYIDVFAEGLGSPRFMLVKDDVVYVSIMSQGEILALRDTDSNGTVDDRITFIDGLKNPHGIDYHDGWFYVAEENRIIRVRQNDNLKADESTIEALVNDLPSGGHITRTVKVHNNSLYFSMGSECNVCIEEDPRRAAITKCNLDGTDCKVFARGLRNSVGFIFDNETIYATDNGRDHLGDNTPPDELNVIEEGKNYGWPVCYGKNIHDTEFDKNVYVRDPCSEPHETPSFVDFQAHSAPLGLAKYDGESFPDEYDNKLFVAFHGSWNRREPTGYKIIIVDTVTKEVKDFATGWLNGTNVLGRPVDIVIFHDSLLVTDDRAGKIYKISYKR